MIVVLNTNNCTKIVGKMPSRSQFSRIDTTELKSNIFRKLGREKADEYFRNLKKLLGLKLSKLEFEKLMHGTIGKENLGLHNVFIKSILSNACLSHGPLSKQTSTGHSRNAKLSNGRFADMSSRNGRSVNSRDRRFRDRPSPLGPHGKIPNENIQEVTNSCDPQRSREERSAPELISIGSKDVLEAASVEDGEEVEQVWCSPGVQSRSPITAPLGLSYGCLTHKALYNASAASETCHASFELPDTMALRKQLEAMLEHQGIRISVECANLLNNGLDAYMKRLIRPCIDLARSRCSRVSVNQEIGSFKNNMNVGCHEHSASLLEFQVAMESNRQLLGGDWPLHLEKISSFIG